MLRDAWCANTWWRSKGREMVTRPLTAVQLQAALEQANKDASALRRSLATEQAAQQTTQSALKSAQQALSAAQDQAAATEATASKKLTEAVDLVSRLKLAATAASDRELKASREADALREQNASLLERLHASEEPGGGNLDAQLKLLKGQIDGLLTENQRLAQQRDTAQADNSTLFQRLEQSAAREKEALAAARQAAAAESLAQLKAAQENARLGASRIAALTAQLSASGKLEVLAPEQVGHLMGGFLQQLETGMPTLRLAEGELKLKLGLARSDKQEGFVILPPDAGAELSSSLHEISLRFDRGGATVLKTDPQ